MSNNNGLRIISASERLAERRGAKMLICGPVGVGKTSLLRTLNPARTLFLDVEAGDLSVLDVPVDTIRINTWADARDVAVRVGGPNLSYPATSCYSEAHFKDVGGELENLDRFDVIFVDSITQVSRLAFRWAEQQPEAFAERSGKKDVRGAYGLLGREMLAWLNHLQHTRGKSVVFVAILEKVADEFGKPEFQIQLEGGKTGRELPGIVDQVITMNWVDFGDGALTRAFVCTSPNQWQWPAKDRSGRLEQYENPDLGELIAKLTEQKSAK